jgi:hypothetical protein
MLGHKSLDDYVSHIVVQNIEMEEAVVTLTLKILIAKNYSNDTIIMAIKMSNHDDTTTPSSSSSISISCYWLCNRKAELKVYTDFGNILHLCKRCYKVYDPLRID